METKEKKVTYSIDGQVIGEMSVDSAKNPTKNSKKFEELFTDMAVRLIKRNANLKGDTKITVKSSIFNSTIYMNLENPHRFTILEEEHLAQKILKKLIKRLEVDENNENTVKILDEYVRNHIEIIWKKKRDGSFKKPRAKLEY